MEDSKAFTEKEQKARLLAKEVTLKNVQISKHLSEETLAFTASVYLKDASGRLLRVGIAKNCGNGGESYVNPVNNRHAKMLKRFEEKCNAELGRLWGIGAVVDYAIDDYQLKKQCKTAIVFRNKDDNATVQHSVEWPGLAAMWRIPGQKRAARKIFLREGQKRDWFGDHQEPAIIFNNQL